MRNVLFVLLALGLLLLQSSVSSILPLHPFVPSLLLPMVLYLGVTPDVTLGRGAALAFTAGLLSDEMTGTPVGLTTFIFVATFLLTRVAGLRLFLRGVPFQIVATAGITVIAAGAMLALCAIFEQPEAFPLVMPPAGLLGALARLGWGDDVPLVGRTTDVIARLVATGLATGLVSPLVYIATRRLDTLSVRTRRGAGAEA